MIRTRRFDTSSATCSFALTKKKLASKWLNGAVEVMNSPDPEIRIESRQHAYRVLNQTIRKTGNSDLRFELAKITNAQEAISIVDDLLAENPADPAMKSELAGMMIRSLFAAKKFDQLKRKGYEFIGYDAKADEFDLNKVAIQGEPEVYVLISQALLRDKEEDLARRVIDHMVEANPDSAEAYLHKSNFLAGQEEYDESKQFLDKAYESDPNKRENSNSPNSGQPRQSEISECQI